MMTISSLHAEFAALLKDQKMNKVMAQA